MSRSAEQLNPSRFTRSTRRCRIRHASDGIHKRRRPCEGLIADDAVKSILVAPKDQFKNALDVAKEAAIYAKGDT